MRGQVCDAPHSIALDFHIGAEHLTDQWLQATQLHNEELVVG